MRRPTAATCGARGADAEWAAAVNRASVVAACRVFFAGVALVAITITVGLANAAGGVTRRGEAA